MAQIRKAVPVLTVYTLRPGESDVPLNWNFPGSSSNVTVVAVLGRNATRQRYNHVTIMTMWYNSQPGAA
jgi:hypothetical protein